MNDTQSWGTSIPPVVIQAHRARETWEELFRKIMGPYIQPTCHAIALEDEQWKLCEICKYGLQKEFSTEKNYCTRKRYEFE